MSLLCLFHCESSISVRPAPPGPEAHDGRPAKATPGVGASAAAGRSASRGGGPGGPGGAASTGPRRGHAKRHRGASQRRPHLTPNADHTGRRARIPRPYCGVPRSHGPSPRSASGTARPAPRGPGQTRPWPGPRAETRSAPPGAKAAPLLRRAEQRAGSRQPGEWCGGVGRRRRHCTLQTFSGQCYSSSMRRHSSSDDACPRPRTRERVTPRVVRRLSSSSTSCSPSPRRTPARGLATPPARAKKGLRRSTFTVGLQRIRRGRARV